MAETDTSRSVRSLADLPALYAQLTATPDFQRAFGDPIPLSIIEPGDAPGEYDMPDPLAVQAECGAIVATIFDLFADTRLAPLAAEVAWGIVNSFHFTAQKLERREQALADELGDLARRPDLSRAETMSVSKVLVVEDDPVAADYIRRGLERSGRTVEIACDGHAALHIMNARRFDAIILDRMLPRVNGLTILDAIRSAGSKTPVLILSAISSVGERVRGLQHGADDYVVKPFHISELVARIDVLLRRDGGGDRSAQILSCEDLRLDLLTRIMTRGSMRVKLQDREFGVLRCLMEQRGKPVARAALLKSIWNYDFDPGTNIVDVHISRLRAKLDAAGEPGLIKSVRGIGYRIGRPTQ